MKNNFFREYPSFFSEYYPPPTAPQFIYFIYNGSNKTAHIIGFLPPAKPVLAHLILKEHLANNTNGFSMQDFYM